MSEFDSTHIPFIDIAIGVLKKDHCVCLSLRQKHQSHANHWEFPGGKVEANEMLIDALKREFTEELNIETDNWQKLIEIPWHYEEVSVRLHVYTTETFNGEPIGNEGQRVEWFSMDDLDRLSFPEANKGILKALKLPNHYMISGSFDTNEEALAKFSIALNQGVRFGQLRAKELPAQGFNPLAHDVIHLFHRHNATILLNGDVSLLNRFPEADGIQLASNTIYRYEKRPISKDKLLGVSTHTKEDINHALKIDADFILLSPVRETSSHPGLAGLGWETFSEWVKEIPIPVFALGGMRPKDAELAKNHGGQGIAAISGFWPAN